MPKVEVTLNLMATVGVHQAIQDAALETIGVLRSEIITAQVMPFDTGTLQGSIGGIDQYEDGEDVHTSLCVGDTPYARRLYFHPEYNFQTVNNPNAGGLWTVPWLPGGDRESFIPDTFQERLEGRLPK